eukprot:GAHX01003178.1.p1 GENE.GAHX01003178.1~~GAHX01003178.1.p1  ORF type:complete len:94 (-),score=19.94 GAHX01003178.1:35-316(-)
MIGYHNDKTNKVQLMEIFKEVLKSGFSGSVNSNSITGNLMEQIKVMENNCSKIFIRFNDMKTLKAIELWKDQYKLCFNTVSKLFDETDLIRNI